MVFGNDDDNSNGIIAAAVMVAPNEPAVYWTENSQKKHSENRK